ncbi:MAG: hypothetical protein WC624_02025 [Candidatus Margulisiibacteriota bacterium]
MAENKVCPFDNKECKKGKCEIYHELEDPNQKAFSGCSISTVAVNLNYFRESGIPVERIITK